jgi:thiosulfate reductase cytochrome b subunit
MSSENTKLYFYPFWLRIWHAVNAVGIILLIITGISMQSGFETSFIEFSLAVNLHNISGIVISLNYLLFFVGNFVTKNVKFYLIKPQGFLKRPMKQIYYYAYGMFRGMKPPYPLSEKRKFNPLQKYAYVSVMYLFVTICHYFGFWFVFPETIIEKVYTISGVFLTAVVTFSGGLFYLYFPDNPPLCGINWKITY